MKRYIRYIAALLAALFIAGGLVSCNEPPADGGGTAEGVDYAAQLTLDTSSSTKKQAVTVKTYVDGDTTHFFVPESVSQSGVLKARYLAINTPESTGKIEEYGKAAAKFTREKLEGASEILVESDDGNWNIDSTGSRYLVWVWYKTRGSDTYRNLNVEILQNGLAIASSSANNRYGETCMAALNQAKSQKLGVHSGKKDPDFYYGEAHEITLKELRANIEQYNGTKVAFNGVIVTNNNNSVYVEAYDAETDMYFGMSVYYGYGLSGEGLDILAVGNEARIVGTVQYYEAGGTYQVSGLTYRQMKPDDPSNIKKLSEGNPAAYTLTDPERFASGKVELELADEIKSFSYAELSMSASIAMNNLTVKSIYTTNNEDSASNGAMTLTCEAGGVNIDVRTVVLYDESGALVTADAFEGKNISVRGVVDYFNGSYQIKVFSLADITVNN